MAGVCLKRSAHIVLGLGSSLLIGVFTSLTYSFILIISGVLGSLFPDLDLRYKHRILLHNILMLIVSSMLTGFLLSYLGFSRIFSAYFSAGFFMGYMSHLIGDLLTYRGVALLYPFSRKMFKIPIGSSESTLVNLLGYLIGILFIAIYIFSKIRP